MFCKLTVVIPCTTQTEQNSHHTQIQGTTTTLAVRCVYNNIECLHCYIGECIRSIYIVNSGLILMQ